MPAQKKIIPLHKLGESTDQGYMIKRMDGSSHVAKEAMLMDAHRDDHYLFFIQQAGRSKGMVDFGLFTLQKNTLFFILPGQVHRYLDLDKTAIGWFVALDVGLVPEVFRAVLEDPLLEKSPLRTDETVLEPLLQCLQLVDRVTKQQPSPPYQKQMVHGLLTSFVAMVAALHTQKPKGLSEKMPRPLAITQQFRKSLTQSFKTRRSPAEYATELNLSLSYLNEAVKATTGLSVSHWIQQEIVLEAKRLLYHSDSSVKEIAYELGYEDPTYFSRLFKKTVGKTPGDFREQYRK